MPTPQKELLAEAATVPAHLVPCLLELMKSYLGKGSLSSSLMSMLASGS